MGIIIGEKNPKLVQSEDIGNLARMNYGKYTPENAIGEKETTSNEEKSAEDLKAQQEKEAEEKAAAERKSKLEEIGKLPEEEQVAVLLEAGFEEEANELSAKLAEKGTSDREGQNETDTPTDSEETQTESENGKQVAPKKAGRPKKS